MSADRTRAKMSFTLAPSSVERLRQLAEDGGTSMSAVLDALISGSRTSDEERRTAWDRYAALCAGYPLNTGDAGPAAKAADLILAERDRRFPCE